MWGRRPGACSPVLWLEFLQCVDSVLCPWMAREDAAAARALRLHEPRQRIDHDALRIAGAGEDLHPVAIGGVLLGATVAARDEGPCDGCDATATGEDLVENDHPDPQSDA